MKSLRYIICLLFSFLHFLAFSQKQLKGTIVEQETSRPIPGASVFLSNTSIGTTANQQGQFELMIPSGRFDLIVSSIGFETYNQTITSTTESTIIIKLLPKVKDLEAVVVEPFLKDGWEKWGAFFLKNFIGTSALAKDCRIKNSYAIKFRNSKVNNELSAYAMEPLIIENKALGYIIHYQLESFTYSFKTHYLLYEGYPFFEPMKGGAVKQKKWVKQRQKAYEGSVLHFMRSLYRNTLTEEGFAIKRLKKLPNTEKQRVKEVYAKTTQTVQSGVTSIKVNSNRTLATDSSEYYNKIMRQPDYFDILNPTPLTGDSIAYAVNATTAGLAFDDYLLIVYKQQLAPPEYSKAHPDNGTAMASQLTLINGRPIEVLASGYYYSPVDLLNLGYWAWSEKIAMMLPFDYIVPNK